MKTLQTTFFLFVFVPLANSAPPIQQESLQFYEYDTDVTMGSLIQQDYEMQSKDIRKVFYLYYHSLIFLTAKHCYMHVCKFYGKVW